MPVRTLVLIAVVFAGVVFAVVLRLQPKPAKPTAKTNVRLVHNFVFSDPRAKLGQDTSHVFPKEIHLDSVTRTKFVYGCCGKALPDKDLRRKFSKSKSRTTNLVPYVFERFA